MTIDFYYAEGSGSCRVVSLIAKALGIELNLKHLNLMNKEQLSPEFVKINPQHCVPTIVDNDFPLWEGNVIAIYLIQKYGKDDSLYPKDIKKRAVVDQRLYFANGVLYQRFSEYYYPIFLKTGEPDPEKLKKIQEAFEFMESFLDGHQYIAGDSLSVADYAISTAVSTYDSLKFDFSSYKNVTKWVKMTIDFYCTMGSGPCRLVGLVAKNLGIELNSKQLNLMNKEQLSPAFVKINPQHCVPTIVDNGFALWEGNAIATYLIQKYGKDDSLYPKDIKKRAVIDQRLYFANGVLYQRFAEYYYPVMMGTAEPDPEKYKKMQESFEFMESFLDGHQYIAGDTLSVADYAISTIVSTFLVAKFDLSSYKHVTKWYNKVKTEISAFEEFNNVEALTKLYEQYFKK
ncbi:hypothetical protein FQA39_LY16022 [Lamprigera yunnana]|nr:hypothetical protein FQA39_LY16022 [Lamprigera yunnana]